MTTDERTGDPGGGPPSQAADGEGRVSPLWLLVFGLPGLGLLAFWGTAVLKGIGSDPARFVLFRLAFAIPAVGLIRMPFHLAAPSPRLRKADRVLVIWGFLINFGGFGAFQILALICAAPYALAIAMIAVGPIRPDSRPGRREGAETAR